MNTLASKEPQPTTTNLQPATGPGPQRSESLDQRIARLPKATRDMLNVMLDDGLPYHVILEELGETAQGLNAASLAKWVQADYQDYLKNRQTIEDVKTEAQFAADFLRALGEIDPSVIHHASLVVASLQMFQAIREFGDKALRETLLNNPSSYFDVLDALCKIIPATINLENHRHHRESIGPKGPGTSDKKRE